MRHDVIENLFDSLDEMAMLLVEHANLRYLPALTGACANILEADVLQEVDTDIEIQLYSLAKKVNAIDFEVEEVRKALQLALLKGLKADYIPLDQMTPDGIALILAHILKKLVPNLEGIRMADFVCGTGNLVTAVLNQFDSEPMEIFGVDTDYQMLELSKMMADMQEYDVTFYHQSSTRAMAVPLVDLIIGDLPVSGKPDSADKDSVLAQQGCDYLPYLLVENHLKYLIEGGIAAYIIGNDFFSSEHAAKFHQLLTSQAQIGMLVQLPTDMFKSEATQKSILVVKKSTKTSEKVEPFVASLPVSSDIENFKSMLTKLDSWIILNNWVINKH